MCHSNSTRIEEGNDLKIEVDRIVGEMMMMIVCMCDDDDREDDDDDREDVDDDVDRFDQWKIW